LKKKYFLLPIITLIIIFTAVLACNQYSGDSNFGKILNSWLNNTDGQDTDIGMGSVNDQKGSTVNHENDTENETDNKDENSNANSDKIFDEDEDKDVTNNQDNNEQDNTGDQDTSESSDQNISNENEITVEIPSVKLRIYEGPLYTESGDICYYRIEAITTGIPEPSINFSKDYSNGAWGTKKCQVNLYNPGDSYMLNATASNSEGIAKDSINLIWGNNEPSIVEEDNGENALDSSPQLIEVYFSQVFGGWIAKDTAIGIAGAALIGDHIFNVPIKGFLSFDISPISGKEIIDTQIEFDSYGEFGNPMAFLDFVSIEKVNWGEDPPGPDHYDLHGISLGYYGYPTFTCTGETLENELQKAANSGDSIFQISLENMGFATDYDGKEEYLIYGGDYIVKFSATYIP